MEYFIKIFFDYYIPTMPVTKSDLINETAISCGIARDDVRKIIEQFFHVVQDIIKEGKSIELRGFGTFSLRTCNSRVGRNLQTGELISLAPHKNMSFKFSPELKAKITGSTLKPATASKRVRVRELAKTDSL